MTIQPSAPSRSARGAPPSDPSTPFADLAAMGVPVDLDSLTPAFLRLVEETVAQVEACPLRPDVTFDGYESLIAAIRSATTLEGTLLEKGIALVAAANPDLVLVGLERPLPVHEAARAVFRRNDWSRAAGLRLDSEVATREHYMPDLLIVDGTRNLALIVDVKRSAASYKPRTLAELRSRMMASALVVRDVLEREHDAPPISRADIAIIDGSGECRDEVRGIFTIADLDWMLRIDGAAEAIAHLRGLYGARVRSMLDARCTATVMPRLRERQVRDHGDAADGLSAEQAVVEDPADGEEVDEDPGSEEDGLETDLCPSPIGIASIARSTSPRVVVGIARRNR